MPRNVSHANISCFMIENFSFIVGKQKQQEMNKNKEIIVLNHKRSNAINIGMTKLPPPRSIKTAILKMDATIMNREGIEVWEYSFHTFILFSYLFTFGFLVFNEILRKYSQLKNFFLYFFVYNIDSEKHDEHIWYNIILIYNNFIFLIKWKLFKRY